MFDAPTATSTSDSSATTRPPTATIYDLWAVGSGLIRQITDNCLDLHRGAGQVWFREHAWAPWLIDLLTTTGDANHWVHKRDPEFSARLADVT